MNKKEIDKKNGWNSVRHVLISFFCLFNMALAAEGTDGTRTHEIPLTERGNRTHITVKIGEVKIPGILLDTGFAFDGLMIYNPEYRDSLDLSGAVQVRIGGAGNDEDSRALMLDSAEFHVGGNQMMNQRVLFLQGDRFKDFASNGIIGYSLFGHYFTELDYDRNRMILHSGDSLKVDESWTPVPLFFKDNQIPWMEVSVVIENEDPVPLSVYIDYAADDVITLLEKPGMKFHLPEQMEEAYLGRGLSGDIYGKKGVISKFTIGPYGLSDVTATIAPAQVRSKQDNADAIVGAGALRRFNLIFDYKGKKLYVKPNRHFRHTAEGDGEI